MTTTIGPPAPAPSVRAAPPAETRSGSAPSWRSPGATAQLRLTAAAAAATALATLGMNPVFLGRAWLTASLLVIAAVAITGAAARLLHVGRVGVVLLEALAATFVVTARFVPDHAWLGVVPTRATLTDLADLARLGTDAINQQTVPVTDVPGIVLLVAFGVAVAAIEVDFTAVGCRCPAVSGVMLLALYAVPVVVLPRGASWVWFVAAAVGWLVLLYVGRREALREWGTTLATRGVASRAAPSSSVPSSASASAVLSPRAALAWQIGTGAVLVPLLITAVLPGIGDGALGRVGDSAGAGGGGAGGQNVRLDLTATVQRGLATPTNTPLLTYTPSSGLQQYLRLAVLDRFKGVTWTAATPPANPPSIGATAVPVPGLEGVADRATLTTVVVPTGRASELSYLPAPYLPVSVTGIGGDWRWDQATSTVFSRTETLGDRSFTVTSEYVQPDPAVLATQDGAKSISDDTAVPPPGLPAVVATTAARVTAGADSDYAKAVRLQDWFRTQFRYDLNAPPTNSATAIDTFLTQRVGYCQQFAATYALMARTLGLHARVVVGFAPGSPDGGGTFTVGTHDYHAWPEVWFDGVGWVRFEPTPRTGEGSTVDVPTWSLPGPLAPVATPSTAASSAPAPTASSNAPDRRPVAEGAAASTSTTLSDRLRGAAPVLVLLLLSLAAAGPGLARALRRRRRLGPTPGPSGVEAAWDELADTATDLGLPWHAGDTPRRTAEAFTRRAGLDGESAAALDRLRHDVEQARYAGGTVATVEATRSAADEVRTVRSALLDGSSPGARWRARLAPRTAFRRSRG